MTRGIVILNMSNHTGEDFLVDGRILEPGQARTIDGLYQDTDLRAVILEASQSVPEAEAEYVGWRFTVEKDV